MGSSVSAFPQPQGGNWPVLLHADIALAWSPGGTVEKCALPPFPFQSAARTAEQHHHPKILDERLTTLLEHATQFMRNITRNGQGCVVLTSVEPSVVAGWRVR